MTEWADVAVIGAGVVGLGCCYPLTISDGFSRYLLRVEGLSKTKKKPEWPCKPSSVLALLSEWRTFV